jgi:hypothetical protein
VIKFSLGISYGEFNYNKYQNIRSKEQQKIIYSKSDERQMDIISFMEVPEISHLLYFLSRGYIWNVMSS